MLILVVDEVLRNFFIARRGIGIKCDVSDETKEGFDFSDVDRMAMFIMAPAEWILNALRCIYSLGIFQYSRICYNMPSERAGALLTAMFLGRHILTL